MHRGSWPSPLAPGKLRKASNIPSGGVSLLQNMTGCMVRSQILSFPRLRETLTSSFSRGAVSCKEVFGTDGLAEYSTVASIIASIWSAGYWIVPPHLLPIRKVLRVKLPKLFAPPLRAYKMSGLSASDTVAPLSSTMPSDDQTEAPSRLLTRSVDIVDRETDFVGGTL